MRDTNSRKKLPARSAGLGTRETRHRPQQGLDGMCRRQVDRETPCVELIVTLGLFNRGGAKSVNSAQFLGSVSSSPSNPCTSRASADKTYLCGITLESSPQCPSTQTRK